MATFDQEAYDMAPNLLRPRGTIVVVAFAKSLKFKAGANPLVIASKMVSHIPGHTVHHVLMQC